MVRKRIFELVDKGGGRSEAPNLTLMLAPTEVPLDLSPELAPEEALDSALDQLLDLAAVTSQVRGSARDRARDFPPDQSPEQTREFLRRRYFVVRPPPAQRTNRGDRRDPRDMRRIGRPVLVPVALTS